MLDLGLRVLACGLRVRGCGLAVSGKGLGIAHPKPPTEDFAFRCALLGAGDHFWGRVEDCEVLNLGLFRRTGLWVWGKGSWVRGGGF